MAKITLGGGDTNTIGELPAKGTTAPEFCLTGRNLKDLCLKDFTGKRVVLNIFPSLDTAVCATSVRKFNEKAAVLDNTVVLAVSRDLPFAHERFCSTEGITNVVALSELRDHNFGRDYGVEIVDGPMKGLLARSVVVIDEKGKVIYTELVPEIASEPDYDSALKVLL